MSDAVGERSTEPSVQTIGKSVEQKTDLLILKCIREIEEDVVIAVEKALKEGDYSTEGKDELQASQFRNLVRVADTTESPAVVKNFLRYQVGRDNKWGRGVKSLAERIVSDIDGKLQTWSKDIAKKADSSESRRIHMELIRRYLGYGSRRLKYLSLKSEEKINV